MKWIKKGHIFKPSGEFEWMNSHTTPATAIVMEDRFRVFFSTRSKMDEVGNFISNATFLDLDKTNPEKVLYIHNKPIIQLGVPGTFDEFGIMVAKPVYKDGIIYLYYMGWQRLSSKYASYQVALGLAISKDFGFNFEKISSGPILGIDTIDHISIGNVSVLVDHEGWKMWYTSFKRWETKGGKPTPVYNIKYATSQDGILWRKMDIISIEENEQGGVATPSVIKHNDTYHMWFGYRKPFDVDGNVGGYKVGYAASNNGLDWNRNDNLAGIDVSDFGWDSHMICAPHIVAVDKKYYMFYCGNGFGVSGFGYAVLDAEG